MASLDKVFANDPEVMRVIKDPILVKQVILVLQETTDQFMAKAEELLNDERKSVQQRAQVALDVANKVLEAEKKLRIKELKNISEMMGNRGLGMDLSV